MLEERIEEVKWPGYPLSGGEEVRIGERTSNRFRLERGGEERIAEVNLVPHSLWQHVAERVWRWRGVVPCPLPPIGYSCIPDIPTLLAFLPEPVPTPRTRTHTHAVTPPF